jgi:hypothetical protein
MTVREFATPIQAPTRPKRKRGSSQPVGFKNPSLGGDKDDLCPTHRALIRVPQSRTVII